MSLIIVTILILVIVGLLVWAWTFLPIDGRVIQLLQVLTIVGGVLVIAGKAGLLA